MTPDRKNEPLKLALFILIYCVRIASQTALFYREFFVDSVNICGGGEVLKTAKQVPLGPIRVSQAVFY